MARWIMPDRRGIPGGPAPSMSGQLIVAGKITVVSGKTHTITCNSAFQIRK